MEIKLPRYIRECIAELKAHGHTAYCVGGAVRDALLGLAPKDYDIATSALPEQVISYFPHTAATGLKHGTVTVITDLGITEITTYRFDGSYSDSRHPESVRFTDDIREDLIRRDFTVNALAFDGETLVDVTGGVDDIKNRIIRAVGDPDTRFREDALRIMRAFRFASVLGFSIEDETREAAIRNAGLLKNISAERIASELLGTLSGDRLSSASDIFSCGMLRFIGIGAFVPDQKLYLVPNDSHLRLAAICFSCGADTESVCRKLKLSRAVSKRIKSLFDILCKPVSSDRVTLKRMLRSVSFDDILLAATAREALSGENLGAVKAELSGIMASGEPYKMSELAIDGGELEAIGFKGERVGKALTVLLEKVTEDPSLNDRSALTEIAKKML